jgi:hypothetical protein
MSDGVSYSVGIENCRVLRFLSVNCATLAADKKASKPTQHISFRESEKYDERSKR